MLVGESAVTVWIVQYVAVKPTCFLATSRSSVRHMIFGEFDLAVNNLAKLDPPFSFFAIEVSGLLLCLDIECDFNICLLVLNFYESILL